MWTVNFENEGHISQSLLIDYFVWEVKSNFTFFMCFKIEVYFIGSNLLFRFELISLFDGLTLLELLFVKFPHFTANYFLNMLSYEKLQIARYFSKVWLFLCFEYVETRLNIVNALLVWAFLSEFLLQKKPINWPDVLVNVKILQLICVHQIVQTVVLDHELNNPINFITALARHYKQLTSTHELHFVNFAINWYLTK